MTLTTDAPTTRRHVRPTVLLPAVSLLASASLVIALGATLIAEGA